MGLYAARATSVIKREFMRLGKDFIGIKIVVLHTFTRQDDEFRVK